ncbi:HtaA domain-containing protein [Solirubrobacter soli]|uniref:HtaA domain-containing protein n=1 Tax=Solirubrobacter soli TaxID=363832 RepID=UPI00040738C4|nr:HtaA domain-containing protein [Solirubrobacter soli]
MRKTTLALAAGLTLLAAAPAADAADYSVTGGKLDWTIANVMTSFGDPARSWLGYVTFNQVGNPGSSNGTASATAPATLTGPTGAAATSVTPDSVRGADQAYTFGYPVAAGGKYTDKGVGTVETKGTVTFTVHGVPITVVDPLITLDGLTGTLKASGVTADRTGTPSTYDRSTDQFKLDLSNAEVKLRADGSRRITGIVPLSTATTQLAGFGANSNRYGTMSLTLALDETTPQVGAAGRDGKDGVNGTNGKDGRDAELRVIRLKKAPFKTTTEVHVRLVDRATGKTVASGTAERRTLRLGVLSGTTLKGTYLLKRTAKKATGNLQATVTIG